ncbi:MAG: fused MFS/spermidine synthase [Elusimicrobiota bacterium]|jgi:spermidine synthase
MKSPYQNNKALDPAQSRYVMASLFITGASTLILEIVGTRVISPYYGSSLYCWSALITVTLVALAAGYNLGGRAADRGASLTQFARLLCLGAAAVALVPLLRSPVLRLASSLGIQVGALASATVLIAPALVLLSMLGPISIRLTALGLDTVGRRAGDVYAVSTLGSVLGAVAAGFVLIPNLTISQVFYGVAVLLLALGALGYKLALRRAPLPQLAAAVIVALFGFWPRALPKTNVLFYKESAYGQIKVLDVSRHNKRYLLVNGTSQSVAQIPDMESDSQYAHALEWAPLLRPDARRALIIGLGAGLLPAAWERRYGLTVDAVEIDPEILTAAKDYFGYAPKGRVFLEDGRTFMERGTGRKEIRPASACGTSDTAGSDRYDLMVLDAFNAESPPYHLFSREALAAMKKRLSPGGILGINIVAQLSGPGNEPWVATYKALQAEFPEVRAFVGSSEFSGIANVLIFASEGSLADAGAAKRARAFAAPDLALMLAHELIPSPEDLRRAPLMTDDHAPMEFLLAKTAGVWRRNVQRQISEVILY